MAGDRNGRRRHIRRVRDRGGEPNLVAGMVAGLVGGLVASWAMNEFQALWSKAAEGYHSDSAGGHHDARDWQERGEDANATELAAQALATRTIDRRLTRKELKVAAPAVHYAFGGAMGALYGTLSEVAPETRVLEGGAFGAAVWIGGDEIAVPWLGLSKTPDEYPIELHAQALAAHIVYGVTTEFVRRSLRALF